jgi:hypothetical protein
LAIQNKKSEASKTACACGTYTFVHPFPGNCSLGSCRQDPHVPREGRATIYNALADAGTNFSWHEFNGAHAFMRDEGARYDAAAARTVYAMALDLFRRKLSEGGLSQIQGATETRH